MLLGACAPSWDTMEAQFQADTPAEKATPISTAAAPSAAERVRLVGGRVRLATESLCERPEPLPNKLRAAETNSGAGCAVAFELSDRSGANAYSYGDLIIIDRGLVRFAGDDAELAFVLAHELAHSLLGLRKFANREERQRLEMTADNIALYLLARAGYDLRTGVKLLRRMAIAYPKLNTPNHPPLMARFEVLERVIAKLDEAGASPEPGRNQRDLR